MLAVITFTEEWRCFKPQDTFAFRPGVNLLVGDQGCGKSSLIGAIRNGAIPLKGHDRDYRKDKVATVLTEGNQCQSFKFDFEHDNFQTKPYFDSESTTFHVSCIFKSHGEQNRAVLANMADAKNSVIFMDEPDMALSIRSINRLIAMLDKMADAGNQVIAAVHNQTLIEHFPLVLSLEHRMWMPSDKFIESQSEEPADAE